MLHYELSFPVRYYETDQMGVVHHSNYIRYFETARDVMLHAWGYPIEEVEKDGFLMPIVSVECRYKHPAKMGDIVRVTADIEEYPHAKLVVKQAVYNQDNVVCAEGQVVLGFLNKATGRPVRCPEKLSTFFERLQQE